MGYKGVTSIINQIGEDYREILSNNLAYELDDEEYKGHSKRGPKGVFWLLFLLKARGVEFCVRMKDDWWLSVKEFAESSDMERIVTYTLPKKDRKKLADYPQMMDQTISSRLIKIELENGEYEILCTSLTDIEKSAARFFCQNIFNESLCSICTPNRGESYQ